MLENRYIVEKLTEFHKIIDDLKNIEVNIDHEDENLLLLNSLSKSFEHLNNSLIYSKEGTIILDEVQITMRSKEFSNVKELKKDDNSESLSVSREEIECRRMSKLNKFYKLMVKYFICYKIGHFMRDCPKRTGNDDYVHIVVVLDEDSY